MYAMYAIYASLPLILHTRALMSSGPSAASLPLPGALVKLLDCVWGARIPIVYMLDSPAIPDWEDMVDEDKRSVKRPHGRWRETERKAGWFGAVYWKELIDLLVVAIP